MIPIDITYNALVRQRFATDCVLIKERIATLHQRNAQLSIRLLRLMAKNKSLTLKFYQMKLSIKPTKVPFMVGDTVWVNQSATGDDSQRTCFQARIIQIILNGSLTNSIVIRNREANHELAISSAIYDLKPVGQESDAPRVSIDVSLVSDQTSLFETKEQLLIYQAQPANDSATG